MSLGVLLGKIDIRLSGFLGSKNMVGSWFQEQLQEGIARWLSSGKKSGFSELESETVVLKSALGKRAENQDRTIFLRVKFDEPNKASIAALVLCDGMGGMVSGGDCADLAISTFVSILVRSNEVSLSDKLETAVQFANRAVYQKFQGRGGATLSAVACSEDDEWAAVNVGDSRIYRVLFDGSVEQLTIDDTLEKQLADLHLPSPPPEFRQLLQYVGIGEGIEPRHIKLKNSSETKWLLITSDGAHSMPERVFQSLISYAKKPREVVSRLTDLSEWLGETDNSTVAVLTVEKSLFPNVKESPISSLEVLSIPGKAEFFSIKPLRADSFRSEKAQEAEIRAASVAEEKLQKERALSAKKTSKMRPKSVQKSDSKGIDGSKLGNHVDEQINKPVPQLKIEFSEEK
jgi:PPM family protein phosphatase